MKITKTEQSVRPGLLPGDEVVCGITHEVQISGDRSWVRLEFKSLVQPDESAQAASARVVDHANAEAMIAVHKVVAAVREVAK